MSDAEFDFDASDVIANKQSGLFCLGTWDEDLL
ncbi:hypothetical protein CGRA01v4_06133 [Colletotrichum graminicola]|nr:hypothetical protein CGRA01v4_06133 [Colletotrichum graminicola]